MNKLKIYLVAIVGLLTIIITGIDGLDSVMKDYFLSMESL
jgi:hypothetical protein